MLCKETFQVGHESTIFLMLLRDGTTRMAQNFVISDKERAESTRTEDMFSVRFSFKTHMHLKRSQARDLQLYLSFVSFSRQLECIVRSVGLSPRENPSSDVMTISRAV